MRSTFCCLLPRAHGRTAERLSLGWMRFRLVRGLPLAGEGALPRALLLPNKGWRVRLGLCLLACVAWPL